MKYFCRNNKECYYYVMNYFAQKVQILGRKNGIVIVLKNKYQGCGKGLVIDCLIGQNILGESCYVQLTNIDGLLCKFNSILMSKLLVNVSEVSMTQSQANAVKI